MAIPAKPDAIEPAPETRVRTAAGILQAAVSPAAAVLTAWGKMPRVHTLLEYLARKILFWTLVCGGGLYVGGTVGTLAVVGSLSGMLFDTGVAAWNERRQPLPHSASHGEHEKRARPRGRKALTGTSNAAPRDAET